MTNHTVDLEEIRAAAARIAPHAMKTPLLRSPQWSQRAGVDVWFKCENVQTTGSFKVRGATNKVLSLLEAGLPDMRGVVTASSGNHGQAVAYAANSAGLACVVVVPETVLAVKEQAIRNYGADVIRRGTTSQARIELAEQLAQERGLVFVPPYDDPLIVAGQGTVGLEIALDCSNVGTVFVPIGGGGLTAGVATAMKGVCPSAHVFAAEPALADDTWQSMQAGEIREIGESRTIADGLRSSHPGHFTFPIVQRLVDGVVLVEETGIETALVDLLAQSKLLVEPSGCTSVAALARVIDEGGERLAALQARGAVVCVLSGGNADLQQVAGLVASNRGDR